MRLTIKEDKQSDYSLMLETLQYKNLWHKHKNNIIAAFKQVTNLDFEQHYITARVMKTNRASGGNAYNAMILPGDFRSENNKLATIVHELSHRLLSGNGLGLVPLGLELQSQEADIDDAQNEIEHRHIYLFEYDVMMLLGEDYGRVCIDYECNTQRTAYSLNLPYSKAWNWAMGMNYEQRQSVLRWLVTKRLTSEDLQGGWLQKALISPETWIKELDKHSNC